jgi:hypothetical protein
MDDPKTLNERASMTAQTYIKNRVDDQLAWYDKKSTTNKLWHYRWQVIALISTAIIPILSLLSGEMEVRVAVACLGALAAIAAGFMSMYQFRDQWADYRTTAELLKYEKFHFLTGSAPYEKENSFGLFVTRIEAIILKENSQWKERHLNAEKSAEAADAE